MKNSILLALFGLSLASCENITKTEQHTTPVESTPVESTPVESTPVESTPVESTPVESVNKINWEYTRETDAMDGTVTYVVTNRAEKTFDLGGCRLEQNIHSRIIIFKDENNISYISIQVDKGAIEGCLYYGGNFRIKFDDEKPIFWNYSASSSIHVVHFDNANELIKKIKNSNKMIIEVEFTSLDGDNYIPIEFNTKGLNW